MIYVFGDYALYTHLHELRHGGDPCPLGPQVFNVLAYLISHRDRVVTKDELIEHLWPAQFVSDATVHQHVTTVRKAIGDSGRQQRIIKTLRSRGYRFIASVEVHDDEALGRGGLVASEAAHHAAQQVLQPAEEVPPTLHGVLMAERKLVTVLYGSLANAVALVERLGLEALPRLRQALLDLVQLEVRPYHGTLQAVGNDSFLVLFGIPVALEDHARRAVLAGLALQRRLQHPYLDPETGAEIAFEVRLGVHTGPVMVGSHASDPQQPTTVVGEVTHLVARLQHLAMPGMLLGSENTLQLVQGEVHSEACGSVAIPGRPEPLKAYTIHAMGPWRASLGWRTGRALSRFVGRERDMAVLEALLDRVVQGQGHTVGIMGEPGMGKSRLLYEFIQHLSGKAVTYVEGRCLSYGSTTPYLPVLDLLRHLCGITYADDPETVTAKVHGCLGDTGADLTAEAPYLLRLLGVPEDAERLATLSPQALKTRTFTTLQQLSIQCSRQQPLVLAVENLHWIDPTSEEWLASLVESLAPIPLLLLTTYRPGYRPLWMDKSYATQIALTRLTPEASRAVVQSMFQTPTLSDALLREIVGKAAGNPFFLEELTRAVVAHGDRHSTLVIPDTIQAVLAARMDQVQPEEKRLLQAAAVIGMDVPLPLLQAIAELPDDALYRGLAHLRAVEFLYEARLFPDHAYTFTHALTRQVAYETLLTHTRQQYHQRTAQVLAERFPELAETQPELLAQHYTQAGLAEEAVEYWQRAGERSRARSADVEAVAHLTQGLDVLRTLPDTPTRAQRELDIQLPLGRAFAVVKGFAAPETGHAYACARDLCHQLGDPVQLFAVLVGLREFYLNRGEFHTARELAEACLALAQRQHDAAPLMRAHFGLGSVLYRLGELVPSHTHLTQAIALYTPQQDRALTGQAPLGVPCFARAAITLWRLGYPDQALARSDAVLTLAQELADAYNRVRALVYAAEVHHLRREGSTAQERAEASLALSTEQAFVHWVGAGTFWRGWALAAQGQSEEGMAQMQQGLAARQATGHMDTRAAYLAMLAEANGRVGQAEAGLCLLTEALVVMDQTGTRYDEPELYRIKGELLLRQAVPDESQAAACFQQALAVARQQQAKSWELRAAMSLGRLWQRQVRRVEALELLAPVYGWFTEGFDTADLQEAKTLLQELS